jgi:negative regulator of flagellin synthesis FlgM
MNNVNPLSGNSPVEKIAAKPVRKEIAANSATPTPKSDRVELSGVNHLLAALKTNDIRADKVAEIRAQIEAGTYETDKKLDIAVDRLLDDLIK